VNLPSGPAIRRTGGGRGVWMWIVATLLGGLLLRVVTFVAWRKGAFMGVPGFEDAVYWKQWQDLAAGGATALPWGSPVYTYLLSWIGTVTGQSMAAILVVQSLLGLALAPLLAWALRPLLLPRHAWIAAFAYAIHPLGPFFEMRLQPVVWILGLVIVATRLLFLASGPDRGRYVFGGLALGAGVLLRPLLFLMLAAAALWIVLRRHRKAAVTAAPQDPATTRSPGSRRRPAYGSGAGLLVALLLLPVLLCGYHATLEDGAFAWNWSDAYFFHRSFEQHTWGTARATQPPAFRTPDQVESIAQQAEARMLSRAEMAGFYRKEGFGVLLERPVTVAGNLLARAALLLGAHEIPDPVSPTAVLRAQAPYLQWGLYLFPAVLGLGLLGLWVLALDGRARRLLIPVGILAAVNVVGIHSAASRWPLAVLLLPAAVLGLTQLPGLLRRAALSPPRWLIPAAGLFVVLSALDLPRAGVRFEDRSEDLREEARMHFARQDIRGATRLLREAAHSNPGNPLVHSDLAIVYRQEELSRAAREEYELALVIDPDCEPALYGLAELLRLQKSYAAAESLALRLVNLHPNHPLYWNELGAIATQMNKFPQARMALTRALQLFPDYQAAQTTLQSIATAEEQAGALLLPAQMLPANDSRLAQFGREALAALPAGAIAEADSISRQAGDEFPEEPFAWYVRSTVLLRMQRPDEAAALLKRIIETAPGRLITTQMAARAFYEAGRPTEAQQLVRFSLAHAADERNQRRLEKLAESMGMAVEAGGPGSDSEDD